MLKLNSQMLPWPADWTALFGACRPLIVEIGFGYGAFLLHLARTNPDANIVGLEISNRSLLKTEQRVERERLENVRLVHTTAETALHHLFTPASVEQFHVNFPDPWFKTDHSHRRLMRRETLDAMVSRLVPGGQFYLATDILPYAEMVADLLDETPGLDNLLPERWASSLPGRVVTKYEATARHEGRDCYYFACRRNLLSAPDVPLVKESAMPHIVFSTPLTLEEIASRFVEPMQHSVDGTHIRFMNAYVGREAVLVETHVGEPTITQHVMLVIVSRLQPDTDAGNEYTIQLGTVGQPRPTAGIHRAVTLLADWVLKLHPANQIVKEKVSRS